MYQWKSKVNCRSIKCNSLCRDHAGGNEKLIQSVGPKLVVGGDDRIGALNKKVGHDDEFKVRCRQFYLL